MTKHFAIAIGSIVALLIAVTGSFVAGVRVGAYESMLLQSTANAVLLIGELRALRAGKTEGLIRMKETELDGQILYYQRLSDEGRPWLFYPNNSGIEYSRHLRLIALYRQEFPTVPVPDGGGAGEFSAAMRENAQQLVRTTAEIIRQYGQ